VELQGTAIDRPLTERSSLEEWFKHALLGPRLELLIEQRGGVRGRAGDLLGDPVGRRSILTVPMVGLAQFPGFPLDANDVRALLDEVAGAPHVIAR
jgi:beta-glucosidase